MAGLLHLRIDVDTAAGIERGVPRLLDLLDRFAARATFFVPMGPDRLVRAALGRLGQRDFASQARQMNPLKAYGLAYLLKGALGLNGRIGADHPETLRRMRARGHEVALHGWDHAWWSDRLLASPVEEIHAQVRQAGAAYAAILGEAPRAFGAPAWRCCRASLEALDRCGFDYISEIEGHTPSRLRVGGYVSRTPNLPVTSPTLFEFIHAAEGDEAAACRRALDALKPDGYNLFVIHTEYEALYRWTLLVAWLEAATAAGYRVRPVREALPAATGRELAVYDLLYQPRRGASGPTGYQAAAPVAA